MTSAKKKTKNPEALPATTAASDLITVENLTPAEIFTGEKITELLNLVKGHIDAFKPDPTTEAGRAEIVSFAHKVTKSKTLIEKIGDDYARFLKDEPKRVDKERKRWKDTVAAWAEAVRQPVTDIENADKARKEAHQAIIDKIGQALTFTAPPVAANVAERMVWVEKQAERPWDEFAGIAESTIKHVLESLRGTHAVAVKAEADAAELERLRAEKAERDEAERIKAIETAAAEKARQDLLDEQAKAAAAPPAEPEVKEPETTTELLDSLPPVPAGSPASSQRPAPTSGTAAFSQEHLKKAAVNNEALVDLATVLSFDKSILMTKEQIEAVAKSVVKAIALKKVRNVTINYGA